MENVAPEKVAYITKSAEEKDKTVEGDRLSALNDEVYGDVKKFKFKKVLGAGGFGTVFLSKCGEKLVAVKTEKYGKLRLHVEVEVLKAANAAKAKHFCYLIDYEPNYVYMVMTVLLKDLHSLRCEMPKRRFGINTSLRPSMESLKPFTNIHFYWQNGKVVPARKNVGWEGTTRYSSLIARQRQDLGRRDDLESWFYIIVEMTRGKPPWGTLSASDRMQFLYETPKQFDRILTMVDSYSFESQPEYDKIYKILEEVREEKGVCMDEHWEWEDKSAFPTTCTGTSYSEGRLKAKKEDLL